MENFESIGIIGGLIVNACIFIIMYRQLSQLSSQTELLKRNIQYSSYVQQVEQLNIINSKLLDKESLSQTFNNLEIFKDTLSSMSASDMGFAWLVINRYECAFVGNNLGVVPESEWEVWVRRMKKDFSHPLIRKVWKDDIDNFDYNPDFKSFINMILAEK